MAEHIRLENTALPRPGAGVYCDLWLIDLQADRFHKLTGVRSGWPAGGSLMPRWNAAGTKLVWTDWIDQARRYGKWQLAVADFRDSPEPHLENVKYYRPCPNDWYEAHGFGPDDAWIYFSCSPVEGMDDVAMDIARMDLTTGQVTRLTETSGMSG